MSTATDSPPQTRPPGQPWTFAEAAPYLTVSVKHLRFLADTGKVDTIRIGKRKRLIPDAEMRRISREGV